MGGSTTKTSIVAMIAVLALLIGPCSSFAQTGEPPQFVRFENNPIIKPSMLLGDNGENINGPSLIRVPEWVSEPLGKYYLYFAHHKGSYIRMAYSDSVTGPWTVYTPGTLQLKSTVCDSVPPGMVAYKHVASPDVHVDEAAGEIRMYFHCPAFLGGDPAERANYRQVTLVAKSSDGLNFDAGEELLGRPYFRVFRWDDAYYALGMPGVFYRSSDGLTDFVEGPTLFTRDMRHSALKLDGNILHVFYTIVGESPERILLSKVDLTPDWMHWKETEPVVVLEPELPYEGGHLPLAPSARGAILEPVRQLRDPAIFLEGDEIYLLYSVAGEQGIAIGELQIP